MVQAPGAVCKAFQVGIVSIGEQMKFSSGNDAALVVSGIGPLEPVADQVATMLRGCNQTVRSEYVEECLTSIVISAQLPLAALRSGKESGRR